MIGLGIVGIYIFLFLLYKGRPRKAVVFQIYFSVIMGFVVYNLGAPRTSVYLCDVVNIWLLMNLLFTDTGKEKLNSLKKKCMWTVRGMLVFFLIGTISAIANFSGMDSILLYLWSCRNYFRFFIFFIACVCYLNKSDVSRILNILRYLLYISTVLSIYQYFVLGYGKIGASGDLIGGIFGTVMSGNASLCLFMAGLCVYFICGYLNKEVSLFSSGSVVLCSLASSVLSEIKFFLLLLVGVGAILILLNKPNIKTFVITILGALALSIALTMIQAYYAGSGTSSLNSISGIIEYVTKGSYSFTNNSINRIGGVRKIKQIFFNGKMSLLGKGMGMADHSSFFSSRIYDRYGSINYSWFIIPYLYLEVGLLGVISYCAFYLGYFTDVLNLKKISKTCKKSAITLCAVAVMMMVYNASLRMDAAYVFFAFMAFPLVYVNGEESDILFIARPRKRFKVGKRKII